MIKRVVLLLLMSFFLYANDMKFKIEGKCVPLKDFSSAQREVILYAYYYGKNYGFGYTMAAIAWKESCAGEYLINFSDPSAGIYHALIPGVIKQYTKYKDSVFLRNIVGQMLVSDPEFASSIVLDHLRYWHKVRKGDFEKIIKSYNKGYSWEKNKNASELAQNYYLDIIEKVKLLHGYIPAHINSYKIKEPKKIIDYKSDKDKKFHPYAPGVKSPSFYLMNER